MFLALDLEEDFDAFEGGGDEGHGDGGEEAGEGDLRDAVLVVGYGREGVYEAFPHVVALGGKGRLVVVWGPWRGRGETERGVVPRN